MAPSPFMQNPEFASQNRFPLLRLFSSCAALFFWGLVIVPQDWWMAILTRSSGLSAQAIVPAIPEICTLAACVLTGWALATWLGGRRGESWFFDWLQVSHCHRLASQDQETKPNDSICAPATRTSSWTWLLLCVVAVLWFDWPAITGGYFESDDFYFLIEDRMLRWQQLLFAYTNDHLFPIVRLQIRLMHWLFGVHAVAYNLVALGSLMALLFAGVLLLRELHVSRMGLTCFVFVCINWTLWGEFTSGEYILLGYEQLMTWSLLIAWGIMRWKRLGQRRYLLLVFLGSSLVSFANMSGLWVVCAGLVFLFGDVFDGFKQRGLLRRIKANGLPTGVLLIPAILALGFYVYAYTRPDSAGFLSVARERHGLGNLMLQWFYTMTTAILSIVVAIPHHLGDFRCLMASMILSAFLVVGLVVCVWGHLSTKLRYGIFCASLVMSGVSLMICLGRPGHGYGHVVPPKYLFLPYVWLCVLLACTVDGILLAVGTRWKLFTAKCIVVFLAIAGISHGIASLGGWRGVPFFATTRGGELREHRQESAALAEIRAQLFEPLEAQAAAPKVLELPGFILCQRYPVLRYSWGQEPWLSHFIDVLARDPDQTKTYWVHTEFGFPLPVVSEEPAKQVDPAFLNLLASSSTVQKLYLDPVEIALNPTTDTRATAIDLLVKQDQFHAAEQLQQTADGRWKLTSTGSAEVNFSELAQETSFGGKLYLECEFKSDQPDLKQISFGLSFQSAITDQVVEHRVVPRGSESWLGDSFQGVIDLRQLPGYVLHDKAVPIRFHFRIPGEYVLSVTR